MNNPLDTFWHLEIPHDFNRHRRVYRDILLYYYLLATDDRGTRTKRSVDRKELLKRVHIPESEFNLALGTMGVIDADGVMDDESFERVRQLTEETYAPYEPMLPTKPSLTPRWYLEMMFRPLDLEATQELSNLISELFRGAMSVQSAKLSDTIVSITSTDRKWGVFIEILPSPEIVADTHIIAAAVNTLYRHTRQNREVNYYYLLVCPNISGDMVEQIYNTDGLWIIVGTSMVKLLRGLRRLASRVDGATLNEKRVQKDQLASCFEHFFDFGTQEYTVSVGEGLARIERCTADLILRTPK